MSEGEHALTHELFESLGRFDRAYHTNARGIFGYEKTPGQVIVLFILHGQRKRGLNGLRVSEIADSLHVTTSNITQMVTDLEGRGLVARKMDETDRRGVKVSLTQEGLSLVDGMKTAYSRQTEKLVKSLGEERARTLIGLLADVVLFFSQESGVPADERRGADGFPPFCGKDSKESLDR